MTKPKNLEELWDACKVAFHAIPDDFINKLYDSLPNWMAIVLQAKGGSSTEPEADQGFAESKTFIHKRGSKAREININTAEHAAQV